MSKLDYVTIAIVAICIMAIVFFVYKMTDLFGDKQGVDKIETVANPVEEEGDIYDDTTDATGTDANAGAADSDQENVPTAGNEDLGRRRY